MAQTAEKLSVVIEAVDKATPKLRLIKNETKQINETFKSLNPSILGITIGIGSLIGVMTKAVREFQEAELAQKRLTVALQNAGVTAKEYQGFLDVAASRLEALTGFSDEQIATAQAMLVTFGLLGTKLDDTTKLALDLSVAFGVNLEAAAQALGKAYQGNFRGLQALGIKIDETLPKSEALKKAFDELRRRIGGQATGAGDTLAGAFRALSANASNFFEVIGGAIAGKTGVGPGSRGLTQLVKDINMIVNDWKDILGFTKKITPEQQKAAVAVQEQADASERVKKAHESYIANLDKSIAQDKLGEEFWKAIESELERINNIRSETVELEREISEWLGESADAMEREARLANQIERDRATTISTRFSAVNAPNASGLAGIGGAAIGGPVIGSIAEGITELVVNSGELPAKIEDLLSGLEEGISDGIPTLIRYLSSDFLPNLIGGLALALGSLVTGIPGLIKDVALDAFRTSAAVVTLGISEGLIAIGDELFGGDDAAKGADITSITLTTLKDQVQKNIDILTDIETERFNSEIKMQEELLNAAETAKRAMESLKDSALSAIRSAISFVSGALASPEQNVAMLRAAHQSAASPEARSSAASALAGGLQGQFNAAQQLASIGAITGEELARVQQEVLGQLGSLESETISEFDRLIATQQEQIDLAKAQIDALNSGFQSFKDEMALFREFAQDATAMELSLLQDIAASLRGRVTGSGGNAFINWQDNLRNNAGNVRGRLELGRTTG